MSGESSMNAVTTIIEQNGLKNLTDEDIGFFASEIGGKMSYREVESLMIETDEENAGEKLDAAEKAGGGRDG